MQRVAVLDTHKNILTPCSPKRARLLLKQGKAAVYRRYPAFTIILKRAVINATPRPFRVKLDPGSKVTGAAVVSEAGNVIFAAELEHRGETIKSNLAKRRAIRRSRRNRKTRYRAKRFNNRKSKRVLAPSLESRVANTMTLVNRLMKVYPIAAISVENVKFDMQAMENPDIGGAEYQQGALAGYEVREYLLEKWGRKCAYCGAESVPLEVEHIKAKSKGGSDRISNLTLACRKCNEAKGSMPVKEFLKDKPEVLKSILAHVKKSLSDAAAVNSTKNELLCRLQRTGLPVETGSGGLTKFNRTQHELPKAHWIDAACVGRSTPVYLNTVGVIPLQIKATGHGNRQMCRVDKYGFPRTGAKGSKFIHGFQTGDMVKSIVIKGKKIGVYTGKVAVRTSSSFNITKGKITIQGINYKTCRKLHMCDGYSYSYTRGAFVRSPLGERTNA